MTTAETPLTAIILTHRLDQRLEEALASVQFAPEVILAYDQAHAQEKPAIAQKRLKKLAEIYQFRPLMIEAEDSDPSQLDFSQLRQQLLSAAHQPWVFYLDSDEYLDLSSIEEIKSLIQKKNIAGIRVKRDDYFLNQPLKFGEVRGVNLLRLAKKDELSWRRPVHEVAQVEGQIINSKIRLWHQAHLTLEEFIKDVTTYARLEAIHRHQQGRRFKLWQLLLFPPGKFIFNYFFKLGFLDGWPGLVYATIMSLHSLAVRVFQYELELT